MWAPCTVLSYDRNTELFHIVWANGRSKHVKRLNLIYDDETPQAFRKRIRRARRYKADVEATARYFEYVDQQPMRNPNLVNDELGKRLAMVSPSPTLPRRAQAGGGEAGSCCSRLPGGPDPTLLFCNPLLQHAGPQLAEQQPHIVVQFLKDAAQDYERAVKRAIVDLDLKDPRKAKRVRDEHRVEQIRQPDPVPEQGCLPLDLFGEPHGRALTATAEAGVVNVEDYPRLPFGDMYLDIALASFHGKGAFVGGMQFYQGELDVSSLLLIDTIMEDVQLPCVLEEFAEVQRKAMADAADALKGGWVLRTQGMIEEVVNADTSAGTLDVGGLNRDPSQVYDEIDLQIDEQMGEDGVGRSSRALGHNDVMRFVKSIGLRMTDQLRSSVLASVAEFLSLMNGYDFKEGGRRSKAGVPDDLANGRWGSDLFVSVPPPLFKVHFVHSGKRLEFQPSLDELCSTVLSLFDAMVTAVDSVPDVSSKYTLQERNLPTVQPGEEPVVQAREEIDRILRKNMVNPEKLKQSFSEEFESLIGIDEDAFIQEWSEAGHTLESNVAEIDRLKDLAKAVEAKAESGVNFALIRVDCSMAKSGLAGRALELRRRLQQHVCDQWTEENRVITGRYEELCSTLSKVPASTEEMDALAKFLEASEAELPSLEEKIHASGDTYRALATSQYIMPDDAFSLYWEMTYWPVRLNHVMNECRKILAHSRSANLDQLKSDQKKLVEDLQALHNEVEEFGKLGDMAVVEDRVVTVADIEAKLQRASELAELYQSREAIFGLNQTEYPQLAVIQKNFEPTASLWKTCAEFSRAQPEWMDGPFTLLDPERVAADSDRWFRSSAKLMKILVGPAGEVVRELRKKIEKFLEYIPLVTALRNPGLRDRHWAKIATVVGFPVKADTSFSLSRAVQLDLTKHMAGIEEVSEFASKEYSLERTLDKMQASALGPVRLLAAPSRPSI